jgi:hypothetical protein
MTIADPSLGSLVGVSGDRLIAREACRGLPCPVVSLDISGRGQVTVADAAGQAILARDATGRAVVVYEPDPDGSVLLATTPDGRDALTVAPPPPGLRLIGGASSSGGAAEHAADQLVFGPGGRLPLDGSRRALVRQVAGGTPVALDEVLR